MQLSYHDAQESARFSPQWPKAQMRCGDAAAALHLHAVAARHFRRAFELAGGERCGPSGNSATEDDTLRTARVRLGEAVATVSTVSFSARGQCDGDVRGLDVCTLRSSRDDSATSEKSVALVASASLDGVVRVWQLIANDNHGDSSSPAFELRRIADLDSHGDKVTAVVFATHTVDVDARATNSNTVLFASGGLDRRCFVWSAEKSLHASTNGESMWNVRHVSVLAGHNGRITAISWIHVPAFTKSVDACIVTSSTDKTVRLWNVVQGACVHVLGGAAGAIPHISARAICSTRLAPVAAGAAAEDDSRGALVMMVAAACNNGNAIVHSVRGLAQTVSAAVSPTTSTASRDDLPTDDGWACTHVALVTRRRRRRHRALAYLLTAMVHPERNEARLQCWDVAHKTPREDADCGQEQEDADEKEPCDRSPARQLHRPVFSIDHLRGKATHLLTLQDAYERAGRADDAPMLAVLLSADGTLRIIDIEAHGVVLSVFDIHPMPISVYGTRFTAATCAALTAGIRHGGAGACLATGGKDATIRIWNLANVTGGVGNTDASDRILDLELNTGADVSSLAWLDGDTTSSFDSNSGEDDTTTNRDYAHAPKPKLVSGTEQGSLCIWNVYH